MVSHAISRLSDFVIVVPEWADLVLKSFGAAVQIVLAFLLGYTGGSLCSAAPFPYSLFKTFSYTVSYIIWGCRRM